MAVDNSNSDRLPMRRHSSLIYRIFRFVEQNCEIGRPLDPPVFDSFTEQEVGYHVMLCAQAGYLDVEEVESRNPYRYLIRHLNWAGHEALGQYRREHE